ncbi:MAG: glycerol-3-phosphate 1-O-acyltransferase PlsY [Bacteroidota bacterium]|nr:glycerol-3-phosphate 1-O-acyltransferase PlsY [Chlorobiota bacterium]MDW8074712.1 glycerol-3-phosphate 1-O-acyltransferase PlsY [Bacteroidota bacterium]
MASPAATRAIFAIVVERLSSCLMVVDAPLRLVAVAIVSYLLGSFPTAVVVSKLFFGFDIRSRGSGNMGSTNAFRVLGWKWGLLVQVVDVLKGVLAVTLVADMMVGHSLPFTNYTPFEDITVVRLIAGTCAVIGHIFSVFVGFRGGKGVNTAAGMLIGIAPVDITIAFVAFVIAVALSGYVSLGSLSAAVVFPSAMVIRHNVCGAEIAGYNVLIWFSIAVSALVIYAHRSNIQRLLRGQEHRFDKLWLIRLRCAISGNKQ